MNQDVKRKKEHFKIWLKLQKTKLEGFKNKKTMKNQKMKNTNYFMPKKIKWRLISKKKDQKKTEKNKLYSSN